MKMAYTIAEWSSCFRKGRSIGCVIVRDKRIMTTGYNGAPAGIRTCREKMDDRGVMICTGSLYLVGMIKESLGGISDAEL